MAFRPKIDQKPRIDTDERGQKGRLKPDPKPVDGPPSAPDQGGAAGRQPSRQEPQNPQKAAGAQEKTKPITGQMDLDDIFDSQAAAAPSMRTQVARTDVTPRQDARAENTPASGSIAALAGLAAQQATAPMAAAPPATAPAPPAAQGSMSTEAGSPLPAGPEAGRMAGGGAQDAYLPDLRTLEMYRQSALEQVSSSEASIQKQKRRAREARQQAGEGQQQQQQQQLSSGDKAAVDEVARPRRAGSRRPAQEPSPALERTLPSTRKLMSMFSKASVGKQKGTAGSAVLTGHSKVGIDEASMSARVLVNQYRETTSRLREMMSGHVDHGRMISDDEYAEDAIVRYFDENVVMGVCEKSPTTNESDAHVRRIRAHRGPGARIHPIVNAMWNADFDGDALRISFDPVAISSSKSAMDFLIGTDGENKIDPDFFGMAKWDSPDQTVEDVIDMLFGENGSYPIGLTKLQKQMLAEAIEKSGSESTVDEGFRSMLRWVREIGGLVSPDDRDAATARILSEIWSMNVDIRVAQFEANSNWRYLGPVLKDAFREAVSSGLDPDLEHNLVIGTPPSSINAYSEAVGGPIGFIEKRNAHFRFVAGLAKLAKAYEVVGVFEQPRSYAPTAEMFLTKQISGLATLEDSGRGLAQSARDLVIMKAGVPDTSSDAAFEQWLYKTFTPQYNKIATAMNAALANFGLDGRIVGYERVSMPFIRTDNEIEQRRAIRSEFLKVYGKYAMGSLFGKDCPKGWERATLNDYVRKNQEGKKTLGDDDTEYTSIKKFIGRLADLRTSFAKKFDERLMGGSGEERNPGDAQRQKKQLGLLERLMAYDQKGSMLPKTLMAQTLEARAEQIAAVDGNPQAYDQDLVMLSEMFHLLGKEVFFALGLNTPYDFMSTKLGLKFVRAKSPNQLGGALYEAVARYRYEPIREAEERLKKAREVNDAEAAHRAEETIEHELAQLASSSDVWAAVVNQYKAGIDVFEKILFKDIGKTAKDKALAALVRDDPSLRNVFKTWEVAYNIFSKPGSLYSTMRFTDDQGHTTLMNNLDDVENMVNRWSSANWDAIVNDVKTARKKEAKKGSGRLKTFLSAVSSENGHPLVYMDPHQVIDVALGMEPSFASSEKSQQEYQASYIYQLVSYMRNGETFSDIVVGGDFALGSISMEALQSSPAIIAKLLTDETFSIDVYDDTGADMTLSMESIFGTTSPDETEIWDWLERHPRAAAALRMTTIRNTINNKTGFSYKIAVSSLSETISEFNEHASPEAERAMKTLADHPGFYAMMNLTIAMTGKKRIQARNEAIPKVDEVIRFIRGLGAWRGNTLELVEQVARSQGIDWDAVEKAYQDGEEETGPIGMAPLSDARFIDDYQRGQVFHRLARDLDKYSVELERAGFPPLADVDVEWAAALFNLSDGESMRGYFRAVQELSGSKTSQSTSINGAMSKKFTGMQALSRIEPDPCDGPDPDPVPLWSFRKDWQKYAGLQVRIPGENGSPDRWIPVNEVTIHRIDRLCAKSQQVLVEDPALCTDQLCPCKRHATADPSTNFGKNQTSAIGRFLDIVRSLSTEGLNLKVATVGDDGTDSISKFDVFDIMDRMNAKASVMAAYAQTSSETGGTDGISALAAARRELARILEASFHELRYDDVFGYNDYLNIAQILVRPVTGEDGTVSGVRVISMGQASAIIDSAIRDAGELGMREFSQAAYDAIRRFDRGDTLDIETVFAGVRVAPRMGYSAQILDKRTSATERNFGLMRHIQEEIGAEPHNNWELDRQEEALLKQYILEISLMGFEKMIGKPAKRGGDRRLPRITGVFPAEGKKAPRAFNSIGPQNTWIIDAKSKQFVDAMSMAYDRGLNILLSGEPTDEQWDALKEKMESGKHGPMLDKYQGVDVYGSEGFVPAMRRDPSERPAGRFISTFDIRLNGGNTTIRKGAFDAGVFYAPPKHVSFFFESIANEFGLSDSEFAGCKSWLESIRLNLTGNYALKASTAFANLIDTADLRPGKGQKAVAVRMMDVRSIVEEIIDPVFSEDGDPVPIDLGVAIREDSEAWRRFEEDFARYVSRIDEADPETGLLMTGRPGEILGWMEGVIDGRVAYHPIRLYENDNKSGAPTDFEVTSAYFDKATQRLVVEWEHTGTMEGRTFKMFEDLYSADKFIGRAEPIPDITIASGLKLSGMISKASTASRRLFMRRRQLMTTLMFMARMDPFGYNIAEEQHGALLMNEELKARLLTGEARIGEWIDAMTDEMGNDKNIEIFSDDPELNAFANHLARKAIRYNINPTVLFASRYEKDGEMRPSGLWFNFQVLFSGTSNYQDQLMKLMSRLNPNLCPAGTSDESTGTLFNSDLQILVPVRHVDRNGNTITRKTWVDVFGGFHFFDMHFTGASNSGFLVDTYGLPQAWATLAGNDLSDHIISPLRGWAGIIDPEALPNVFGYEHTADTEKEQ